MKTNTKNILLILKIVAWLATFKFCSECGSQLASFIISFYEPGVAQKIFAVNESLFTLIQHSEIYFILSMLAVIILSGLKGYVWIMVIKLLLIINIKTPFSLEITKALNRIAYGFFAIWFVGLAGGLYIEWLAKTTHEHLNNLNVGGEFLFIAGIVYIISQIIKRGIELQEENQLTV